MHKDDLVRFRAVSQHVRRWRTAAAAEGRSLSEWLRWLADRRVEEVDSEPIRTTDPAPGA